jgi:cell division protein ZapA (FtsZ GTPase activity inhibitor)
MSSSVMFSGRQYRVNCGTSQPLALVTAASMPHGKNQVDKAINQQWVFISEYAR